MKKGENIIRILEVKDKCVLIIDCIKKTMPKWYDMSFLDGYEYCLEDELGLDIRTEETLPAAEKRIMHERYTLIAGILPFVSDEKMRSLMISKVSEQKQVSKQTVRKYLCLYLSYQDMSVLAPVKEEKKRELTADEKNIRWAINKFFYTKNKNILKTAYTMMLKEKYCDINDSYKDYLLESYEDTYYPEHIENSGKAAYVERNLEMINKSKFCVVYYDENYLPARRRNSRRDLTEYQPKSCTKIAYEYATKKGLNIINVISCTD